MYSIRHTQRRLPAPVPQPTLRVVPTVAPTNWPLGIFAATVLVALFALGAWLDDDSYLLSHTAAAESAYLKGLVDGLQRGRDEATGRLLEAWYAGLHAGQAHGHCAAPMASASGVQP